MKEQNKIIKSQLAHRTIREFTEEQVPADIFNLLMQIAQRTASSNGLQASSIIRITDSQLKAEIAEICNQEYVARVPELLIFVADQYRNSQIVREQNHHESSFRGMDSFFSAYTDACITAQNVVTGAEALGLGTVYLGSILNEPQKICEILNLPELTFPVVGLGIGYPNQEPQLKPRMDMDFRVFENSYQSLDNYNKALKDYDQVMNTYYDLRDANKRVDSFTNQVVAKANRPHQKRQEILNNVQKMGFDLYLKP